MNKLALISVSDKTNLVELAQSLRQYDYSIIATGGTAIFLKDNGFDITEVSSFTGFPEIMDGRVKTLNPLIFAGILFKRDNQKHQEQLNNVGAKPIDVVCVNLYPFKKFAENKESSDEQLIENIDIGGPSLIRAAAKNHESVSVLTDPEQYKEFTDRLTNSNHDKKYREKLAVDAFYHTYQYDAMIFSTLTSRFFNKKSFHLSYSDEIPLRYGENPHQSAGLFGDFYSFVKVLHGKELSYNNIMDIVSAVNITEEFDDPACAIIKHTNPAGVAQGTSLIDAYNKALSCDPVSAFGGIVSINGMVEEDLAVALNQIFLEVIIADGYTEAALSVLMKKKDRRLLIKLKRFDTESLEFRYIPGGLIFQNADSDEAVNFTHVAGENRVNDHLKDLNFAWKIVKHVRSNAIVFIKDQMTLGIGGGQVSRIDSVKLAVMKAQNLGHDLRGSCVASDAFFPFPDGVEECAKAGATVVVQPGGSVKDDEVVAVADKLNISMYFTGRRHFKH